MSAPNKVRPKVDLDAAVGRLCAPGGHGAEHLVDFLAHSTKAKLSAHAFLDRLLDIEINEREDRAVVDCRPADGTQRKTPACRRHTTPARHRKE